MFLRLNSLDFILENQEYELKIIRFILKCHEYPMIKSPTFLDYHAQHNDKIVGGSTGLSRPARDYSLTIW